MTYGSGNNRRILPVSTQEFTVVRQEKLVYVDKTDIVWQLANAPEDVVFLSRPRRFGKTMLVSTLEAYFEGRRELFEGLKIMQLEQEWRKYEVLRFDLSGNVDAFGFKASLESTLAMYEERYGIVSPRPTVKTRFEYLIQTISQGERKVVCLFDEYDYPLQHTMFHQQEEHEALKAIYRDFFSVLKAQSRYVRYVFLTGITKFTRLSLFSVLNNIKNISFWPQYQALCGITTQELRTTLLPDVEALAQKCGMDVEGALAAIKERYDGYHFCDEMQEIYNPYSLINALNDKKLGDYWASSGNTQMLMDAVDEIGWREDGDGTFENVCVGRDELEATDVNREDLALFMYQAGYLTIKGYDDEMYTLGIPNAETRRAMYKCIIPRLTEKRQGDVNSMILGIRRSLSLIDIEAAMHYLQALVAETPYSRDKTVRAVEEKFQFIVKNALWLCSCRMSEEKHVAGGRIDLVAEHSKSIMVIELKMTASGGTQAAQEQIEDRHYAKAYAMDGRPVYAVAIEFNGATRTMGEPVVRQVVTV